MNDLMRELMIFDRFRCVVMPDRQGWFPVTAEELQQVKTWEGWRDTGPEECTHAKELRRAVYEWGREREQCDVNLYYAMKNEKALEKIARLCGENLDGSCVGRPRDIDEIALDCVSKLVGNK